MLSLIMKQLLPALIFIFILFCCCGKDFQEESMEHGQHIEEGQCCLEVNKAGVINGYKIKSNNKIKDKVVDNFAEFIS